MAARCRSGPCRPTRGGERVGRQAGRTAGGVGGGGTADLLYGLLSPELYLLFYSCPVVLIPVARSERRGVERAEHATEVGAHLFLFLGQERFQGLLLARFERGLAL